ncbi:MAG: HAD family phosphatase [Erysipelotrichaceae bacterium]|nr:HAD family phosphatase [Erysipelotrichaceae bacterium]
MSIKVIIIDIDGTLTNSSKEITKKTHDALIKAQEMGIKVILASGRTPNGMMDYAKKLDMEKHHGLLVCYNGSRVIDCQSNKILYDHAMSVEDSKAVLKHMKNFKARPIIDKGEYMYVNDVFDNIVKANNKEINILKYESRGNKYLLCEKEDLVEFVDFPLNKILTYGDEEYLKQNYKNMMEPFKDKLNCMFTGPVYFEFTAKGIDKAKALDSVLIPMGYKKEEMIAFGDGHNDISMVNYAGYGIAMANAVSDLKDIADDITLSNEEDGIAHSLYKYIPLLKE